MKFKRLKFLAGLGLAAVPAIAWACADTSCSPRWTLAAGGPGCASRAVVTPGNDSRVNLLLMLRSKAGLTVPDGHYPKIEYQSEGYGRTFVDWDVLNQGIRPRGEEPAYDPDAPTPPSAAMLAFVEAVRQAKGLTAAEKQTLTDLRKALDGNSGAEGGSRPSLDVPMTSATGQGYLAYLKAADAFNAEQWDAARNGFVALTKSSDPWLKETAVYLIGRTLLRQALAQSYDADGWREFAKPVDKGVVQAGEAALAAYLKGWPQGRYAASARGLQRRALWIKGDTQALAGAYAGLLGSVDAGSEDATRLVEEIDNKLLFYDGRDPAAQGALLLATLDLVRMRSYTYTDYQYDEATDKSTEKQVKVEAKITAEEIAAQAPAFANDPQLYGLVKASYAYYVAGDYRQVLTLIPDDARKPSYDTVALSRQVLRGLALGALKDRNEEGFWRELLGGAKAMWQRSTVELGLAQSLERKGQVAAALGRNSVLQDVMVRKVLLTHSAGPEVLRDVATNTARPQEERDAALFTLLYKQLTRGDYAGFVANRSLVRANADTGSGLWNFIDQETVPLGLFAKGRWSDGYACPSLVETARKLAANKADPAARLCLGDFLRINNFDGFTALDDTPEKGDLGSLVRDFKGKPIERGAIYESLVADKTTPANERAYALYRLVRCYAPSGNNSCGGTSVELPQRKAWFQQLKREYPASTWARKLDVYW